MLLGTGLIELHIVRDFGSEVNTLALQRGEKELYPNIWQPVTGKIRQGETAVQAALRELKEETGLLPEKLFAAPNVNSYYSHEKDTIVMIPVFLAMCPHGEVNLSDEHQGFEWVTFSEALLRYAWPGQHQSVSIIERYLTSRDEMLHFNEIIF